MNKIRRWGRSISNAYLSCDICNEMDTDHYIEKLRHYIKTKKVFVFHEWFWAESFLCEWLDNHFEELGFNEIIQEQTEKYLILKKRNQFEGYPDYLVKRKGKWLRLEIECFSAGYLTHQKGYANIVLYFDETTKLEDIEVINLRKFMEVEEIIILPEIEQFLYLYDNEFRKDYTERMGKRLGELMRETFISKK